MVVKTKDFALKYEKGLEIYFFRVKHHMQKMIEYVESSVAIIITLFTLRRKKFVGCQMDYMDCLQALFC